MSDTTSPSTVKESRPAIIAGKAKCIVKKNRPSLLKQAEECIRFYEAHRGPPRLEPKWTHPLFESAYAVVAGKYEVDDKTLVSEAFSAITTPDGHYAMWPFGTRVLQEGFKVGTTSWVFFGRHKNSQLEYKGWVICFRRHEGFVAFMAYHPERPMGMSALTGDEIGPCNSLAETKALIDADVP